MSITVAADPPFSNVTRQANKLMEQMQKNYFSYCPSETWTPSVNLYETASDYLVCVDLAGVEKEKIDVEVSGQTLKLRGTRTVPRYEDAGMDEGEAGGDASDAPPAAPPPAGEPRRIRVHLMEIDHGSFCREVELPLDVDRERIRANYRNGMLWIEIPKS
jgi:HSP20 family protein